MELLNLLTLGNTEEEKRRGVVSVKSRFTVRIEKNGKLMAGGAITDYDSAWLHQHAERLHVYSKGNSGEEAAAGHKIDYTVTSVYWLLGRYLTTEEEEAEPGAADDDFSNHHASIILKPVGPLMDKFTSVNDIPDFGIRVSIEFVGSAKNASPLYSDSNIVAYGTLFPKKAILILDMFDVDSPVGISSREDIDQDESSSALPPPAISEHAAKKNLQLLKSLQIDFIIALRCEK